MIGSWLALDEWLMVVLVEREGFRVANIKGRARQEHSYIHI